MPMVDMDQAFRLDVTPATVMSRWPRVSNGLPDEKLQGMRVALITGLREDDLAGSLTYYFTPSQHCAKLTFIGSTGDPTRFIQLMTSRFAFKPFTNGEPGVMRYEIRWNGSAQSELVVRPVAHRALLHRRCRDIKCKQISPTQRSDSWPPRVWRSCVGHVC